MNVRLWLGRLFLLVLMALGGWSAGRYRTSASTPPALPAEVTARPGRLAVIRAEAGSRVCWHVCPAPQPPDVLPLGDGKELVFVAAQPGRYELIAWSAAGDGPTECARCVVKVEPETPPVPPDPFLGKLHTAWVSETDPQKGLRRDLLVGIFHIAADETAKQASIHTVGELFAALKQASKAVLPDDALPRLREAVAEELRRTLPTDSDTALNANLREKCATIFRRVAEALAALGS